MESLLIGRCFKFAKKARDRCERWSRREFPQKQASVFALHANLSQALLLRVNEFENAIRFHDQHSNVSWNTCSSLVNFSSANPPIPSG